MAKLKMLQPRVPTMDTRRVKPPPKAVERFYLTPEHRAWAADVIKAANEQCQDPKHVGDRRGHRLVADHILERRDRPDLALVRSNGRGSCWSCHTRKTGEERAKRMGLRGTGGTSRAAPARRGGYRGGSHCHEISPALRNLDRPRQMTGKPKRGRGRPPFKPTAAQRLSCERMLASGDSQNTVARALGIDPDTLQKHFAEEIATGGARRRRQVVDAIFAGVGKGNAALIRRAEEMTRASSAQEGIRDPDQPPPAVADRRGKKETRRDEAAIAGEGTEWSEDLKPLPGTNLN